MKKINRKLEYLKRVGLMLIGLALATKVAAYDNSGFPPFQLEKETRGFSWLSIHPNGEQWLITECTDRIAPPKGGCFLFLYNLKTKSYRRYDLPNGYAYTEASFDPSGDWIVGVRRPQPFAATYQEEFDAYGKGEVLMMRIDGSGFRILPAPRGPVKRPAISPDGKKLAYWQWNRTRNPNGRSRFTDYDLRELDLETGADRLFAGDYKFLSAHSIQYLTESEILVSAGFPAASGMTPFEYSHKFGSNELYLFKRGNPEISPPAFSKIEAVSVGGADKNLNIYLLADHKETGKSIVEFHSQQELRHWREPNFGENAIVVLTASPDGSHLGFIYPASRIGSPVHRLGIGMFDLRNERWISLSLPLPEIAVPLQVRG